MNQMWNQAIKIYKRGVIVAKPYLSAFKSFETRLIYKAFYLQQKFPVIDSSIVNRRSPWKT